MLLQLDGLLCSPFLKQILLTVVDRELYDGPLYPEDQNPLQRLFLELRKFETKEIV